MSEPVDMNASITRGELHDAISASEHRIIEAFSRVIRELDERMDQRFAALERRIAALEQRIAALEVDVDRRFREAAVENARMFRALEESMMARVGAMLEPGAQATGTSPGRAIPRPIPSVRCRDT